MPSFGDGTPTLLAIEGDFFGDMCSLLLYGLYRKNGPV